MTGPSLGAGLRRVPRWSVAPPGVGGRRLHNYRVVQRDAIAVGFTSAAAPFLGVFLARFGATPFQLGLFNAVPSIFGLVLAIPLGQFLLRRTSIPRWLGVNRMLAAFTYGVIGLFPFFVPAAAVVPLSLVVWTISAVPQLVIPIAFNVVMSLIAGPGGRFELLSRRWALAVLTTALTVTVCGRVLDVLPFPLNYQVVLITLSLAGPISFLFMERLRMPERELPPPMPAERAPKDRASDFANLIRSQPAFVSFIARQLPFLVGGTDDASADPVVLRHYAAGHRRAGRDDRHGPVIRAAGRVPALDPAVARRGGRVILLVCGAGAAAYPAILAVSRDFTLVLAVTAAASLFQAGLQLVLFDELMRRVPVAYSPTFVAVEANLGHVAGLGGAVARRGISRRGRAADRAWVVGRHRARRVRASGARSGTGGFATAGGGAGMTALVQTVLGPVEASALGPASIHEHLLTVLDHVAFRAVDSDEGRAFADAPVSLETRWWVRQQWVSVRDNLRLTDEATAVAEVARFAAVGGGAIADPTTEGIGRDPEALARISRGTGVHVVMGAGYYVHGSHPAWIEEANEGAIVDAMVADLIDGVGTHRIRAGFIGEIGCSWPMTPRERRVLRAAGLAQKATGAPLMVHPGRDAGAPDEIIRELAEVGADLGRTTICHLERTVRGPEQLVELARRGIWLSLDCFGLETAFYPLNPAVAMPNDGGRLALAEAVIAAGFGDRLLLAQDICQKHRLAAFGGHGYDHLLRDVVPMLVARGHPAAEVDRLVRDNPARFLGRDEA